MKRFALGITILLAAAAVADMAIAIHEPWIRYIPGNRPMAGYLVLENKGDTNRQLVGGSSPAFGMIQIHESVEDGGTSSMRPVEGITVPALDRVALAPGGYHLMLMHRKEELAVGDQVPITLNFQDGGSQSAVFTIKPSWQE